MFLNLTAYDIKGNALFSRQCTNKSQAQELVLNSPYLFKINHVVFKKVKYPIASIYLPTQDWKTTI